ncbi:MAG: hypothetical protein B7Z66_00080 [Chromatiales bacterium 21-64-14]|nr:MAG: hypothetical protein B7Z66_00080 [Chromatiales bacterium 21-64-14]HQU16258.1 efflux RND transporter periplasmic adaptor subunit [Gammaproteobacteria bacterium]
MKKRLALTLLVLAVVFGGIFGWKAFVGHMMREMLAHRAMPPASVSAATVRQVQWAPELGSVGTLTAVQGVEVSSPLAGKITGMLFKSGQPARKGQLLVQIDNSSQRAQLEHDEAAERLARINMDRAKRLLRSKAASQSDVDTAGANYDGAVAQVKNDRATLAKLAVRAPFDGVLGIRHVDLGQYVTAGQALVGLQSWNPLYVDFSLPQQYLGDLKSGETVELRVDAYPGTVFRGTVRALDSRVDPATRNFRTRAEVDNADHRLRPGMFGTVKVIRSAARKVLVVPVTAIAYNTFGDYVFVIHQESKQGKAELTVQQQLVQVGSQRDGMVEITRGLKVGVRVVSAGQLKLHNGSVVVIGGQPKGGAERDHGVH